MAEAVMERPAVTERVIFDGSQSRQNNVTDPSVGKPEQSAPADIGKSGSEPKANEQGQQAPSTQEEKQAALRKLAAEDALKSMNPVQTPEEKLTLLEKQYKASSDEGQKLSATVKGIEAWAKEQGLKLDIAVEKDENGSYVSKIASIATDKYSKDAPKLKDYKVNVKELSEEERDLAIDNPQKFADLIAKRAVEFAQGALARAVPTAESPKVKLTEDKINAVVEHLQNSVAPELKDNKDAVLGYLNNPMTSKVVVDAFHRDPATVLAMVNAMYELNLQKAVKRYEQQELEKQKQAGELDKKVSVMPGRMSDNQIGKNGGGQQSGWQPPSYRILAI
jgi:hypothetical protein